MAKQHVPRTIFLCTLCASISALLACLSVDAIAQSSDAPAASAVASSTPTPGDTRKANRALSRKVYAALSRHKEVDAGNISITARNGAVTLNGTVTEATQISTVVQVAKGVPGVTSITNRLSVQRPIGQ